MTTVSPFLAASANTLTGAILATAENPAIDVAHNVKIFFELNII
ncbi:hypothetical protein [Lactococcus lactis]